MFILVRMSTKSIILMVYVHNIIRMRNTKNNLTDKAFFIGLLWSTFSSLFAIYFLHFFLIHLLVSIMIKMYAFNIAHVIYGLLSTHFKNWTSIWKIHTLKSLGDLGLVRLFQPNQLHKVVFCIPMCILFGSQRKDRIR